MFKTIKLSKLLNIVVIKILEVSSSKTIIYDLTQMYWI